MRSDEVDAGKSIYFLERKQFQPVVNFLEKAKSLFNTKEPIAPAVAPVSKKPTVLPQDYMAQALTKAIAKQTGSE